MKEQEKVYEFKGIGLTTQERNAGKKRFGDYIKTYPHLNKLSPLQLLEELVFLEALQERYKTKIGNLTKNKRVQESTAIPSTMLAGLNENLEQILKLREKLGLFETRDKLDAYNDIENLSKKFEIERQRNPLDYKTTCPFCTKIYFMKRRTKDYEPLISPFFENKILVNRPLMKLYRKGKITRLEYAEALGVSEDYILWLQDRFYKE